MILHRSSGLGSVSTDWRKPGIEQRSDLIQHGLVRHPTAWVRPQDHVAMLLQIISDRPLQHRHQVTERDVHVIVRLFGVDRTNRHHLERTLRVIDPGSLQLLAPALPFAFGLGSRC